MAPHHDYVPGCTYLTCTFCGRRRLFPDELALCDDKKFRCLDACMEKSIMSIDREIAASHYKREAPPLGIGYASQFDRPLTFLEAAAEFRSIVLAGWTPSSQFYDDFTIVPGGVGSSWTVATSGGGTVTQPSDGTARVATGSATGDLARIINTSISVASPGGGLFFCAARFKTAAIGDTIFSIVSLGVGDSGAAQRNAVGLRGNGTGSVASTFYQSFAQGLTQAVFPVEVDTTGFHVGYLWWKTGSPVLAVVDDSPITSVRSAGASNKSPLITVINNGAQAPSTLDVTDYVCWS